MGQIFKSKEVYKHLKYALHNRHEMVPVQGVYVSGEYRPPYYNDPILRIYTVSTQPATVVDFQDVAQSSGVDSMVKIVDFKAERLIPTITNYSTAEQNAGEDSMVKIVDFKAERLIPQCQWYESKSQNAGEDSMVKIVDFVAEIYGGQTFTIYTKTFDESTPEQILRISALVGESATVENYNP